MLNNLETVVEVLKIKEYCSTHKCTKCMFYDGNKDFGCMIHAPYQWGDIESAILVKGEDDYIEI